MSLTKLSSTNNQHGFTIVEILIVITVSVILGTFAFRFMSSSFDQYLNLQQSGTQFGGMALESEKVGAVLRGVTGINSATATDLQIYGYFSPNDTYVSLIHYYISGTKLLCDVTHMTANPPIGTTIPSSKLTYTILSNYYPVNGVNLFNYLDDTGAVLPFPITDLNSINGITVTLSVPTNGPSGNSYSTLSTTVSLRNRKTNL